MAFGAQTGVAQLRTATNGWIDFRQVYYKVAVRQNGIFRITHAELERAGFPVNAVNPRQIQLFYKGEEQAIFIQGEDDGIFNPSDFIEFHGFRNDGATDAGMYQEAVDHTNPYASMYTDQTFYFLTFRQDSQLGKRIDRTVPTAANPPAVGYHFKEEIQHYTRSFSRGPLLPKFIQSINDVGVLLPTFDFQGKGYTDWPYGGNSKVDYSFTIRRAVTNGPAPKLEVMMTGRSNTSHEVEIWVGTNLSNQRRVGTLRFQFYENALLQTDLLANELPENGTFYVSYKINQLNTAINEVASLSYIKLVYPQRLEANNQPQAEFTLPPTTETVGQIEVANVPTGARFFDITVLGERREIVGENSGGTFRARLPLRPQGNRLFMSTTVQAIDTVGLSTIAPIDGQGKDFLIVTHTALLGPAGGFGNAVEAYADYRASAEGGGFRVLSVDINNLYDQFTYGQISPLAVRLFAAEMLRIAQPKFLFLIGKGMYFTLQYERNKPGSYNWGFRNYIPCYGEPCSDNGFTQGLAGTFMEPAIPTGRLSAMTPQDVINYLNKVIEHEQFNYDQLWRKKLLHLSGGKTEQENFLLRRYLANMGEIASSPMVGAQITALAKRTTNYVEFIDVTDEVNDGVGMISFFGHSSLQFTDFVIGYASSPTSGFNNKGKYPFLFMLGCDNGNVFARTRSFPEDWTLTPDKGSVFHLGHSHVGLLQTLNDFGMSFYSTLFADTSVLYQPMGKVVQETIKRYVSARPASELAWSNALCHILSGDPSIRMFNIRKPDYQVDENKISVRSFDVAEPLTVESDSMQLQVIVSNFGLVTTDSIELSVKRTFDDGTVRDYGLYRVPAVYFQDTLLFTLRISAEDKIISGGNSLIAVVLDPNNLITENSEENNRAEFTLFLPKTSMIILAPREFSIVQRQPVQLFAQNTNPKDQERYYIFQIDTASTFNSPAFKDTVLLAGLTPEWKTRLLTDQAGDSIVYYWRVKYANTDESFSWAQSSFVYLKNSPDGWSQSAGGQFQRNAKQTLSVARNGVWSFPETEKVITVRAIGGSSPDWWNYEVQAGDIVAVRPNECGNRHFVMMAFDQFTGDPYLPLPHFWNYCGFGVPGTAMMLHNNSLVNDRYLTQYLENVKEGDFVLLSTAGSLNFTTFPRHILEGMTLMGIDTARAKRLTNGDPFIAFGRKGGAIGTANEVYPRYTAVTPSNRQTLTATFRFDYVSPRGTVSTPRIGPSEQWKDVYIDAKLSGSDRFRAEVIGVSLQGQETVVANNLGDGLHDIRFVDATAFPYLKLRAVFTDTVLKTPPTLRDWKVIYDRVPEGVLFYQNPDIVNQSIVKPEGDSVEYAFKFQNITNATFRSPIVVQYTLQNEQSNRRLVVMDTLTTLAPNDSLFFSKKWPTNGWAGSNRLNTYANPRIQPEQLYENNIIESPFRVLPDTVHPILDVVFDGVRIMDGDIVSATPLVTVSVKDENRFLVRKDTVGIDLFLSSCEDCEYKRIFFNSPQITWSQVGNNDFQVFYRPEKLADGTYSLMVQGADVSGNRSGIAPYKVRFQVVNEASVTQFYPYPNPFSDNVRFVFTLTGSDIPDEIKIQIMTVSGRVVREILQDEIGPIRIGHNMTQYAWDGRDEFGDPLANGVYLYRVMIRSNGQELKLRATAGDPLFKEGFGKMYLMR